MPATKTVVICWLKHKFYTRGNFSPTAPIDHSYILSKSLKLSTSVFHASLHFSRIRHRFPLNYVFQLRALSKLAT